MHEELVRASSSEEAPGPRGEDGVCKQAAYVQAEHKQTLEQTGSELACEAQLSGALVGRLRACTGAVRTRRWGLCGGRQPP
jgi:hypothetical protein